MLADLFQKNRHRPSDEIAPFPIKEVGGHEASLERIVSIAQRRSGSTTNL
jgi:hypothetical protein